MVSIPECSAVNPSSRRARDDARGTWRPVTRSHRSDDLPNREAASGADIDHDTVAAAEQVPDGGDVSTREIGDVDVVAYGGSVRGRVVVTEDGDLVQTAHRGEDRPRDEIGLGFVALVDLAVGVAAASVEVPQSHRAQAVGGWPMCARRRASCVRTD